MISDEEIEVIPSSGNIWRDLGRDNPDKAMEKAIESGEILEAIQLLKDKSIIPYDFNYKTHYLIAIDEE
ncbi:MAG: hypothetical protein PHR19_02490 [Bacteroidales bacterium]|nr:hypothetical protein [Bacteroidales bacterium]